MSFREILFPGTNYWADLYVNSITVADSGSGDVPIYLERNIATNIYIPDVAPILDSTMSITLNNTIQLNIPGHTGTIVTPGNITGSLDFAGIGPVTTKSFAVPIINAGVSAIGIIEINADRTFSIYSNGAKANFSAGVGGFPSISISYLLIDTI